MEYKQIASIVAFTIIFLSALFLFIRNYPSDKEFSVVFIVAGGVLLWCAWGSYQEHADTTKAAKNDLTK
jgi:heme O synthase-like polyprenyltransferase